MQNCRRFRLVALLIIFLPVLVGCGREVHPSCNQSASEVNSLATVETVQRLTPSEATALWEIGAHAADSIRLGETRQEECAQCHARVDWKPSLGVTGSGGSSLNTIPFEGALTSNSEIPCAVCHDEGQGDWRIAWLLDPQSDLYSNDIEPSQLCQNCHQEGSFEGHLGIVMQGVHEEHSCITCHDSHTTTASCTQSGCHLPFQQECETIQSHDKPHEEVTCSACHDASGLEIGWNDQRSAWDTMRGDATRGGEEPFTSHQLSLEVDCDRCHAPGDHPWDPTS